MTKLWHKDYDMHADIEGFTVGDDYVLDMRLVPADCVGSAAHAAMLTSIGLLSGDEKAALLAGLNSVLDAFYAGDFRIEPSDEDVHTAVENRLTKTLGEAGKKLHACRSRNDQIIADLRLYGKARLLAFAVDALALAGALLALAEKERLTPMVGRTHMQKAMPSTVGVWAGAWLESLLDNFGPLEAAYRLNDACPLGSAAGFGVPIKIDREYTSRLLGFERLQKNVLYVNNSRGKVELAILRALEQFVLDYSRLAQDLIIFSLPEFGYFRLPAELTSGSSIMPQKKNPCALELVRAKSATFAGYAGQIAGIVKALPSGYNRDLQETKRPFLNGLALAAAMTRILALCVKRLEVDRERLLAGFSPDVFATDAALELALAGLPFRDAYQQVGLNLHKLQATDPHAALAKRTHAGTAGDLRLDAAAATIDELAAGVSARSRAFSGALEALMGRPIDLLAGEPATIEY